MKSTLRNGLWLATLGFVVSGSLARADEPLKPSNAASKTSTPARLPAVGLLEAMRAGIVTVNAEGSGDGKIAITVTNQTSRKLRVVLPPGLVASGATGQFGGMGGMGGGMGGMGGGMGGMGGGMGGMGGGMGGRGGMGGMQGGMGGRGGGSQMLTMPATMGLMMLGRLIMQLVEATESWNPRSLMSGMSMMGGMGGMGMGGMGGGMGGMGGMMGGMGGGFRSVPPTDLPDATLQPGQTRRLSTRVVSLNPPSLEAGVVFPQQGEKLLIGDVAQLSSDPKVQKALRRLAQDKAPETISQLVLWNVAGKMEWTIIAQLTNGWVNAQELALAQQFVERLDTLPEGESGQIFVEVVAVESAHEALAKDLNKVLAGRTILGLTAVSGVPDKPTGPSIGCKVSFVGQPDQPEALIRVAESNGHREWTSMGKFSLFVPLDKDGKRDLVALGDKVTEGVLDRLVRAKLIKGRQPIGGTMTYTLQIDNASPLILNGFAIVGAQAKPTDPPRFQLGIGLPPQRSMQMPLTPGMVESFGMKKGAHVVALDLSAL